LKEIEEEVDKSGI